MFIWKNGRGNFKMENNTEKTELKKKELSKESSLKYELPDNLLKEMT